MREIKFRVWDKILKRMLSWEWVHDNFFSRILDYPNMIPMQYTGLKDKNGQEIYEGSVVKIPRFDNPKLLFDGKKYDVAFIDGCFELYDSGGGYVCDLKQVYSISEVIGNIYENPELLETK